MSTATLTASRRAELAAAGVIPPPGQDELPYDDGVPMESERHRLQMELLIETLQPWLEQQGEGYVGGNMFLYFSLEQIRGKDFRGPDVFVVLGVPRGERKSWVVWEEGKGPDLVIELLSYSTRNVDKGPKKAIYQDQVRASEYYWYDPFDPQDRAGFALHDGVYQPLTPDSLGRLLSPRLGLTLGCWQGIYKGVEAVWLRWAYATGEWLRTGQEAGRELAQQAQQRADQEQQRADQEQQRADQEQQRADQEQQRADQERRRAEQLAARLRELGVDPDQPL